jgi:pimeloyl-ACP methyl ester carboxylesterase
MVTSSPTPHFSERIACPTLVVAASKDQAVPMHHAKMLHEGITRSELIVIDGDHTLIWTHPDEFVRVVESFLGTSTPSANVSG